MLPSIDHDEEEDGGVDGLGEWPCGDGDDGSPYSDDEVFDEDFLTGWDVDGALGVVAEEDEHAGGSDVPVYGNSVFGPGILDVGVDSEAEDDVHAEPNRPERDREAGVLLGFLVAGLVD